MDELVARPAWAGLDLPLSLGGVTLSILPDGPLASLAPLRGQERAVADALGAALPGPGRMVALPGGGRLIWNGLGRYLLAGAAPDARLAGRAALVDQSDGWTGLALTGAGAAVVLARLVPLDLAPVAFPAGGVARSLLGHVDCLLIAGTAGFEILVARSFTRTAVHDIETAMRAVAARRALPQGPVGAGP